MELQAVYQFQQSPWPAKFSKHNAYQKTNAESNFEKLFLKIIVIVFHRKTLENVSQRIDPKLEVQIQEESNRQSKTRVNDKIGK